VQCARYVLRAESDIEAPLSETGLLALLLYSPEASRCTYVL
jgi:hypothetical protein